MLRLGQNEDVGWGCAWGDIWTAKFADGDSWRLMCCSKKGQRMSAQRGYIICTVILLGIDNVECRARRGNSWQRVPVALCSTDVKCLVNRSLGSSSRPRYRTWEFHGIAVCWKWRGAGVAGRRRVNRMASVL